MGDDFKLVEYISSFFFRIWWVIEKPVLDLISILDLGAGRFWNFRRTIVVDRIGWPKMWEFKQIFIRYQSDRDTERRRKRFESCWVYG